MQSFEIEYVVSGSLDGSTPSPPFLTKDQTPTGPIDPDVADDVAEPDDDNIYRFEVENLGLIDPDFGLGGAFGDRFIVGLWINSPVPGGDPSPIAVVTTRPRELTQEEVVPTLLGVENFYREACIFIPQGSYLGLVGFDASADPDPIVVRLHVKCPQTLEEYALLLESCCCGDQPPPTGFVQVQTEDAPPGGIVTAFAVDIPLGSATTIDVRTTGVGEGGTVATDTISVQVLRDPADTVVVTAVFSNFNVIGGAARAFGYNPATQQFEYQLASGGPEVINWDVKFDVQRSP